MPNSFYEASMYKRIISLIFAVVVFGALHHNALAVSDKKIGNQPVDAAVSSKNIPKEEHRPVLMILPREIDLGSIKPGATAFGDFRMSDLAPGAVEYSVSCPDDWDVVSGKLLRMTVSSEPASLRLELTIPDMTENMHGDKSKMPAYQARMKMETAGKELVCKKSLKAGQYRKAIPLTSIGGQKNIFVDFRIQAQQEIPSIYLNPQRLDLGVQLSGKTLSKKIELTNKSRDKLQWSILMPEANPKESNRELLKERYFSFQNEELPEPGKYVIPEHLKEAMELSGKWTEKNGYPLNKGNVGAMKFRFQGTGISVFLQSHTEDGRCSIYLDEVLLNLPDELSGQWEKKELLIAEGLPDGPHTMTLLIRSGNLELEGVKVFGREMMRGPRGWITAFPNSGTTLSEIDYINVKVDTSYLAPGTYGDQIIFKTNVGDEVAEVFVNVLSDTGHKVIDVFLYTKDFDYLFTADPQAEARRLFQNGYIKEGIAFRLFSPQTPGTMSFYRWYHPVKKDHFYHYDRTGGGKKLDGYVYEGTIGNIATSRMTNTRELYRWFHPSTGRHYYSTDPKAATGIRRGYRFDGIAGYVR
jgi:hypothetical protein